MRWFSAFLFAGALIAVAGFFGAAMGLAAMLDCVFVAHRPVTGYSGMALMAGVGTYFSGITLFSEGVRRRFGSGARATAHDVQLSCMSVLSLFGMGGVFASVGMLVSAGGAEQVFWLVTVALSALCYGGGAWMGKKLRSPRRLDETRNG